MQTGKAGAGRGTQKSSGVAPAAGNKRRAKADAAPNLTGDDALLVLSSAQSFEYSPEKSATEKIKKMRLTSGPSPALQLHPKVARTATLRSTPGRLVSATSLPKRTAPSSSTAATTSAAPVPFPRPPLVTENPYPNGSHLGGTEASSAIMAEESQSVFVEDPVFDPSLTDLPMMQYSAEEAEQFEHGDVFSSLQPRPSALAAYNSRRNSISAITEDDSDGSLASYTKSRQSSAAPSQYHLPPPPSGSRDQFFPPAASEAANRQVVPQRAPTLIRPSAPAVTKRGGIAPRGGIGRGVGVQVTSSRESSVASSGTPVNNRLMNPPLTTPNSVPRKLPATPSLGKSSKATADESHALNDRIEALERLVTRNQQDLMRGNREMLEALGKMMEMHQNTAQQVVLVNGHVQSLGNDLDEIKRTRLTTGMEPISSSSGRGNKTSVKQDPHNNDMTKIYRAVMYSMMGIPSGGPLPQPVKGRQWIEKKDKDGEVIMSQDGSPEELLRPYFHLSWTENLAWTHDVTSRVKNEGTQHASISNDVLSSISDTMHERYLKRVFESLKRSYTTALKPEEKKEALKLDQRRRARSNTIAANRRGVRKDTPEVLRLQIAHCLFEATAQSEEWTADENEREELGLDEDDKQPILIQRSLNWASPAFNFIHHHVIDPLIAAQKAANLSSKGGKKGNEATPRYRSKSVAISNPPKNTPAWAIDPHYLVKEWEKIEVRVIPDYRSDDDNTNSKTVNPHSLSRAARRDQHNEMRAYLDGLEAELEAIYPLVTPGMFAGATVFLNKAEDQPEDQTEDQVEDQADDEDEGLACDQMGGVDDDIEYAEEGDGAHQYAGEEETAPDEDEVDTQLELGLTGLHVSK